MSQEASPAATPAPANRWVQLTVGIVCMVMIANLQYGWNLFVAPIDEAHQWGRVAIQVAFSLFIVTETWLVPVEGWFVDRYGPKVVIMTGGILVAIAWSLNSIANSLAMLYFAAVVAGIGAGCVYGTCVGNALKWFADRRGLAAGLTAAGFGAGAAATVVPIRMIIDNYGYESAFLWFGLGQGLIILVLAQFLRAPRPGETKPAPPRLSQSTRDFAWHEVLRTPLFWVLYIMFVLVGSGGLMATAQLALIAMDFGVADTPVLFLGITGTTLTVALIVDNILNGVARPFFGWLSDQVGREITMAIAFSAGAFAMWALSTYGQNPALFIVFAGMIFFTWGEIYSLFPAACTDAFGTKYAATNAGMLYTAKGTAAILGGALANALVNATGGWESVFRIAAIMDAVAAVMALFVLKPMRTAHHAAIRNTQAAGATGSVSA